MNANDPTYGELTISEGNGSPAYDTSALLSALQTLDATGACTFEGCNYDGAFVILVSPTEGQVCGMRASLKDKINALGLLQDSLAAHREWLQKQSAESN